MSILPTRLPPLHQHQYVERQLYNILVRIVAARVVASNSCPPWATDLSLYGDTNNLSPSATCSVDYKRESGKRTRNNSIAGGANESTAT